MARRKVERLGTVEFDYEDLSRNRGHSYGKGRTQEVMADRRSKRKKTRKDKQKESMKDW